MNKPNINVYINKKTIPWNDRGFNYGDGLFETLLVLDNEPKYLNEHIERLHSGCSILKIPKPPTSLIKKSMQACIGNTKECVVKIILTRGISGFGYKINPTMTPCMYFFKIKFKTKQIQLGKEYIKLGFSKYYLKPNPELSKIKHLGRLEQIYIAQDLLKQKEFDDLIVLDENRNIVECLSSNIFFVRADETKNKTNYVFETPKITTCGIEGVLRNKVINHLRKHGKHIKTINIDKSRLRRYKHCFITNSVQGLIFIDQIGKKKFQKPDSLYSMLMEFIYFAR